MLLVAQLPLRTQETSPGTQVNTGSFFIKSVNLFHIVGCQLVLQDLLRFVYDSKSQLNSAMLLHLNFRI